VYITVLVEMYKQIQVQWHAFLLSIQQFARDRPNTEWETLLYRDSNH
jgi:hypothetical protein